MIFIIGLVGIGFFIGVMYQERRIAEDPFAPFWPAIASWVGLGVCAMIAYKLRGTG
jgi:hypothetical protein